MTDGSMQHYALTLNRFLDHAAKWHPDAQVVTGEEGRVTGRTGYAALKVRADTIPALGEPDRKFELRRQRAIVAAIDTPQIGPEVADALLDYVGVNQDHSWLAYVTFMHPHPPLTAPAPYNEMYSPGDTRPPNRAETPKAEGAQHPFLEYYLGRPRELFYFAGQGARTEDISEEEVRRMRATYLGLISEVDAHIGRIVQRLKDQGDWEDTLIVFTVDHADMLGDHWMFGKDGYFDPAFHIPLIVRDPRREADAGRGTVVESFTEAVDLMPTILEWLGGTPPRQCSGRSLRPFLEGRTPDDWRSAVHWEYDFRDVVGGKAQQALGLDDDACCLAVHREKRFKYVHFAGLPPLLFDLEADPREFADLSGDPAHRETLLRCAQEMLSRRMAHAERTLSNILVTPRGPIARG